MDRDGNEKILNVDNSLCNQKENVLVTDHVQITEKSALPLSTIKYGPLPNESAKMKITIGELVCQAGTETEYTVEDHINELDLAIANITLEQNISKDVIRDHTELLEDLQEKVQDYANDNETLHDLIKNQADVQTNIQKQITSIKEYKGKNVFQSFTLIFDKKLHTLF